MLISDASSFFIRVLVVLTLTRITIKRTHPKVSPFYKLFQNIYYSSIELEQQPNVREFHAIIKKLQTNIKHFIQPMFNVMLAIDHSDTKVRISLYR